MMNRKHYLHILGTAVVAALCSITNNFSGGVGAAEALSASDAPEFELAGITVEAKRPDWESKLSPGTVTVIRPEEYKGEQKDLPDLLKMVPGVHVREVNGKGQYTVVTVRGSTAAQVGVFVDGVMTNLGGDAAVDISTIPVKNVERIEVYRGYIPARFGGTFIGGVINVVTKKPTKANISAELGKASFGGKSASLEVVSPLASGSLLVGLNYEAAKGDFPYKNYTYDSPRIRADSENDLVIQQKQVDSAKEILNIDNWNKSQINDLCDRNEISDNVRKQYIDSNGQVNSEGWLDFVRNGGLIQAEIEYVKEKARDQVDKTWKDDSNYADKNLLNQAYQYYCIDHADIYVTKGGAGYSKAFANTFKRMQKLLEKEKNEGSLTVDEKENLEYQKERLGERLTGKLKDAWNNNSSPFFTDNPDAKKQIDNKIYEEVDKKAAAEIDHIKDMADETKKNIDPETSLYYKKIKDNLALNEKQLEGMKRAKEQQDERHRKYNDRKNISSLIKWQNDNWMVKASYNHIDRHLPDSLWNDKALAFTGAKLGIGADVYDTLLADSKKQKLDTTDLMIQNRQQNGRLEWGWFADYQHQKKKYIAENKLYYPWDASGKELHYGNDAYANFWLYSVLRAWSEYTSNKYNMQIDGSYKLSDRQMLEFQANYSYEKLKIDGSNMNAVLNKWDPDDWQAAQGLWVNWQVRNRYEQKIINLQVQDTITLDKKATWFLTPSWRFNSSTIVGHSDSINFANMPNHFSKVAKWFHPRDSQRDRKGTWQLALKKNVNDNLTFRMTGGTYYRLLNMYEIAGDGAGILPMPTQDWSKAEFPRPEYGKQYDFSTLWNGKLGKSDAYATLTYFWRDTNRMLTLRRVAKDFWCYSNDLSGRVHGIELQGGVKWKKFSIDFEGTLTKINRLEKVTKRAFGDDQFFATYATYQPEWEGNVRFSWFPNSKFTWFGEAHYTGSYYTAADEKEAKAVPGSKDVDPGYPVPCATIINTGIKLKPNSNWQITFGVNDLFNKNPTLKIPLGNGEYCNPAYPLQGRTYYASVRYEF